MRVIIACPEALIPDANSFARAVGLGPDDDETFGPAAWVDSGGARYALASGVVSDTFPARASAPLVEPPWGADMAAAARAQAALAIGLPAAPARLAAVIGDDVAAARATLGLSLLPGT